MDQKARLKGLLVNDKNEMSMEQRILYGASKALDYEKQPYSFIDGKIALDGFEGTIEFDEETFLFIGRNGDEIKSSRSFVLLVEDIMDSW